MTTPLSDERLRDMRERIVYHTYEYETDANDVSDLLAEVERLRAEVSELDQTVLEYLERDARRRARNTALVEVLRRVEWYGRTEDGDAHWCLVCGEYDHENHSTDCALDVALKGEQ